MACGQQALSPGDIRLVKEKVTWEYGTFERDSAAGIPPDTVAQRKTPLNSQRQTMLRQQLLTPRPGVDHPPPRGTDFSRVESV